MKRLCEICGKDVDDPKLGTIKGARSYDDYNCLCWFCMKGLQLKDERDWEDDE